MSLWALLNARDSWASGLALATRESMPAPSLPVNVRVALFLPRAASASPPKGSAQASPSGWAHTRPYHLKLTLSF